MTSGIDVTPLIVACFSSLVPVVLGFVLHFAMKRVEPYLIRFLGEKNDLIFQQRFDLVADKAIGYAVAEGSKRLPTGPITIDGQNWMVNLAVQYFTTHAPEMATQAGELAQKMLARFDSHPAVQGLIGAPPPAPEPVLAGA